MPKCEARHQEYPKMCQSRTKSCGDLSRRAGSPPRYDQGSYLSARVLEPIPESTCSQNCDRVGGPSFHLTPSSPRRNHSRMNLSHLSLVSGDLLAISRVPTAMTDLTAMVEEQGKWSLRMRAKVCNIFMCFMLSVSHCFFSEKRPLK